MPDSADKKLRYQKNKKKVLSANLTDHPVKCRKFSNRVEQTAYSSILHVKLSVCIITEGLLSTDLGI